MTLRHLRIFVAVYQERSITRAADRLHLAQPSVSLAIRELEENYKIRLFERFSRRLFITEQGEQLYDYALHIISLFDEMEEKIPAWKQSATLRIGSSVTIGNFLLPALIQQYTRELPSVNPKVTINNSGFIEDAVLDNRLDFALIEGNTQHPNIVSEPFLEDRICFICSPRHPLLTKNKVTLKDISACPFVLREKGSAGREAAEDLMNYNQLPINIVWESVSTQSLVRAVSRDIGISSLPCLLAADALNQGIISRIPFDAPALHRSFSIIYHKNKYLTENALRFMEMCRSFGDGCQDVHFVIS